MCIRDSITTDTVTIFPTPIVDFTVQDSNGCGPFVVTFNNISTPQNGEDTSTMNFWWLVENDTIGYNSTFTHTFDNIIGDTICYEVQLIGQTQHGCIDSSFMNICVYPDPIAELNLDTINMYCAPVNIDTLGIVAIPHIQAQPNTNITWEIFNSTGTLVATGVGLNCPSWPLFNQNDYVWIVLTATNSCGTDIDSLQFWTSEDPVADFTLNTLQGCDTLTVVASPTTNSSTGTYTWNVWSNPSSPVL